MYQVFKPKTHHRIGDAFFFYGRYSFICYTSRYSDTQTGADKYTRLHYKPASSAVLCGTARTKRYNKPNLRRCFVVGGNKNLPRCGVPCTPLPPCGKRELPPAARRLGGAEVVETETVGDHCYEFAVCGLSSAGVYGVAEV